MYCVDDHAHFMAWAGLVIALFGYLTPFASGKTWWVQFLVCLEASMFAYAFLAASSDAWTFDLLPMVGYMLGITLVLMLLVVFVAGQLLVGISLLLVVPFLVHQIMLLTQWMHDHISSDLPNWAGVVLFTLLIVAVLVIGWVFRLVQVVRWTFYSLASTLNLFVFLELVVIETSQQTTTVCCDWSTQGTTTQLDDDGQGTHEVTVTRDNSACPLDTGNLQRWMILMALLVFGGFQSAYYLHQHRERMRKRYGTPAPPGDTRAYGKLRVSPEPELVLASPEPELSPEPYDIRGD